MFFIPSIDPVLVDTNWVTIDWYKVAYILAYLLISITIRFQWRLHHTISINVADLSLLYGFIGALVGSHIGYLLWHQLDNLLYNPMLLVNIQQGGMSFYGGLLGGWLVLWVMAKNYQINILKLTDFFATLVPLGIFVVAIANFITQQHWGKETSMAFGVMFGNDELALIRHPIQLYNALFQGLLLFILLFWLSRRYDKNVDEQQLPDGTLSALFLLGYASSQLIISSFQIDFINWYDTSQLLNILVILSSISLLYHRFVFLKPTI